MPTYTSTSTFQIGVLLFQNEKDAEKSEFLINDEKVTLKMTKIRNFWDND